MTLDTLVFKKKNSRLETQKKNVDVEFVIKESQDKAKTDMDKSSTHEEHQNEAQEDTQTVEAKEQIQVEEDDEAGKRQEEG